MRILLSAPLRFRLPAPTLFADHGPKSRSQVPERTSPYLDQPLSCSPRLVPIIRLKDDMRITKEKPQLRQRVGIVLRLLTPGRSVVNGTQI
jgi:hypothetical protein